MIKTQFSCQECRRRKIRCTYVSKECSVCSSCQTRNKSCLQASRKSKTRRISITKTKGMLDDESQTLILKSSSIEPDQSRKTLLSVWPSEDLLEKMLNIPISLYSLLYGLLHQSTSVLEPGFLDMIANFLRTPFQVDRPFLIAKKLLTLASYLQAMPNESVKTLKDHDCYSVSLTSRLVQVAGQFVTSGHSMISPSLEGIECDVMEAMFYNNTGDFRRAWLTNRRALAAAQLLGLHTAIPNKKTAAMDTEWPIPFDLAYMWLRIICNDRYLSLVLSLPSGYSGNDFAAMNVLIMLAPSDRMEHLECVAGGLILEYLCSPASSLTSLTKINDILIQAANCMPAAWWSDAPDGTILATNSIEGVLEVSRLMLQITHYHLLIQLHLPEMLGYSLAGNQTISHGVLVACNAARAMLTIYIAFKQCSRSSAHCRGIDVIALVASTTLAIGYLIAREHSYNMNGLGAAHPLFHQRLCDRGLLESTLKIMLRMARCEHDLVAERVASFLRPLLTVEEASWKGERYIAHRHSPMSDSEVSHHSGLKIELPHLGIIYITKQNNHQGDFELMSDSEITLEWPLSENNLFDIFINNPDFDFALQEVDNGDGGNL